MPKSRDELLKERAELLERIKELDSSIELLGNEASVFSIETRRNLRNANLDVSIFEDKELTVKASEQAHGGYISSDALAHLRERYGREEGDIWWVEEV